MALEELASIFRSVNVLSVKSQDTLVFKSEQFLSYETCDKIKKSMEEYFPGIKILVLNGGMDLAVLRKEVCDS